MTKVAVITGASSGLGQEFFHQLKDRENIEEFWVIARRKERLEALAEETDKPVVVLPLDLTCAEDILKLKVKLAETKPQIFLLVNAAGMGRLGNISETSLEDTDRMIQLNCQALADVTQLCLPYMEKGSQILEIASIAAFQPIPHLGIYAAAKSFVESYAKCLHHELLFSGIHVTCVCPYWIRDTEFIPIARQETRKYFRHPFLSSQKKSVVRLSLWASRCNLWVVTPGIICSLQRILAKFVPSCLTTPFLEGISRI
jgi:short-subunit dehydrogenase